VSLAAEIVIAVILGLGVVVVLGAYVWAAREDGRDQHRRDRRRG
jgi:hypothetical protein